MDVAKMLTLKKSIYFQYYIPLYYEKSSMQL